MQQGEWTGDGTHQETCSQDIADLPECRNDLEFAYVSGICDYRRISLKGTLDMMGNRLGEDGKIISSLFQTIFVSTIFKLIIITKKN